MCNRLSIKQCDSAMDEDLNPKMEVRGFKSLFLQLKILKSLDQSYEPSLRG